MFTKDNKGFTLAELLIVVAIIGVLVAISIPIFSGQLEKAREATDAANIRSQYAEVISEALTTDASVNGKNTYGAVELRQKKNGWNTNGLKQSVEGVYGEVKGTEPKAGGFAWVEYDAQNEKAILHYEDGNGGSGSSSSSSEPSNPTQPDQPSQPDRPNTPDRPSKPDQPSDDSNKSKTAYNTFSNDSTLWPQTLTGSQTFSINAGHIYSYNGKLYVALASKDFNQYFYKNPDNSDFSYGIRPITESTPVFTSSDLVKQSNGSNVLNNIKDGDLYLDDQGHYFVFKAGGNIAAPPVHGQEISQWQEILLDKN